MLSNLIASGQIGVAKDDCLCLIPEACRKIYNYRGHNGMSGTADDILKEFNLVTGGNVTTGSDIEGSAVIGGVLQGATFFNNNVPTDPAIDLYGSLGGSLNVDNNGVLYTNQTYVHIGGKSVYDRWALGGF